MASMYLMKRIKNMNYSKMFEVAKKVSQKTNQNYIKVLLDIIRCGLKYQAGYHDYLEFEFYLLNKEERKTYLTRGINNAIVKKYNQKDSFYLFNDKVEFNKKFSPYLGRDWVYLREIKGDEFVNFLKKKKAIIVKPVDGEGGVGIEKININSKTDGKKLYRQLRKSNQVLVEDFLVQHPDMNMLYKNSVNTLRLFTFIKDGKVTYLQGVLKIGNGGVVDNFSGGGMYTFVNQNGRVIAPAIDKDDHIYEKHPKTKTDIIGFQVPMFKEAVKLVKEAAKEVPEIGYVGWDVAIGKEKPMIIEGNCFPGVFQMRPSFSKDKQGVLPRYQKVMDIKTK